MPVVIHGVHMSLMSIVKPGIHMSAMPVVISWIYMSLMSIVTTCIHMIAAMPPWIRKSSRTWPSPKVFSPINATVAISFPSSVYLLVNSIALSIQTSIRTVLGHCRGNHYCYQQNTCTGNYFFHSNSLLFQWIEFSSDVWIKTNGDRIGLQRQGKAGLT